MKGSVPDSVTINGDSFALVGGPVAVGEKAPDFTVVDNGLSPVTMKSFEGRTTIILSVASLDTSTCDTETVRFNREADALEDVSIVAISMDLPFAQGRWCAAKAVESVTTFSDHRSASFGEAYGVLIGDFRLLARAVFIVDKKGILRYIQVVDETSDEPDYDDVLEALNTLQQGG